VFLSDIYLLPVFPVISRAFELQVYGPPGDDTEVTKNFNTTLVIL
jgi:hypothetical protein